MATYYTDKSRRFGPRVSVGGHRQPVVLEAIVAMTTAMLDNANDEVGLFYAPKGFVPCGGTVSATDMDTDGSPGLVIDVGDDSDEDRLFAALTVGQAATLSGALAVAGHMYKYTSDTLIKAYIKTAAVAGAAGTLKVSIWGFVDLEYSTTALTATTTA